MKRILSLILVLVMLFSLAACGANDAEGGGITNRVEGGGVFDGLKGDSFADAEMAAPMAPGESGSVEILPEPGGEEIQTPNYKPGTLTAGEWKDLDNLEFWTKLLNRNDWYELMEKRNLFANKIVPVHVTDKEGNPCYNILLSLADDNGNSLYQAVTDVYGNAYFLYNVNKGEDEKPAFVTFGDEKYPIVDEGFTDVEIDTVANDVKELDLMLMIDTTGSMSDELTYLQTELENVIKEVSKENKGLSIRISVNFYRDEEDEYVIKPYDFTTDVETAVTQLNAQRTDGGGDYPEAVHKALNNIVQEHNWREDAVKLCFFVLDAPPHSEQEISGINSQMQKSIETMSKEGIRLIPVASSGVDTETEFLLRSWAAMTGGTYTFLTNHSGIGNDHLEPTIGEYEVEKLNDLMIRVINEYCGAYPADQEQQ